MQRTEIELSASDFHISRKSDHESLAEFLFKDNNPCTFTFRYSWDAKGKCTNKFSFYNGYGMGIPAMCPAYARKEIKYIWPNNIHTATPEALKYYLENNILNYAYREFGPYMQILTRFTNGHPWDYTDFDLVLYQYNKFNLLRDHLDFYWDTLAKLEPAINITFKNKGRFNNVFRSNV